MSDGRVTGAQGLQCGACEVLPQGYMFINGMRGNRGVDPAPMRTMDRMRQDDGCWTEVFPACRAGGGEDLELMEWKREPVGYYK